MVKKIKSYSGICFLLVLALACVKPYEPEVIRERSNFLVVDGIINCAPNSETTIRLTRTRKLNDTVSALPELNAQLLIEEESGTQYAMQGNDSGTYVSFPLTLSAASRYRLKINTADGATYASDFVSVKPTPPIDSLNWKQDVDKITIYLNTHDPQNNTRYYRWEYTETWEYNTPFEATINYTNGQIVYRTPDDVTQTCWRSAVSTDILQQSTAQLSEDIVQQAPLATFSSKSPRFETKYSINVRQFALTKEAYEYWQILKRNTQQLGSIFDAQPSQLIGNLHSITKADEPVIGYITAATVQQKRIFISRAQVADPYTSQSGCKALIIPTDSAAYYLTNPPYVAAYYVGLGGGAIAITFPECIDCRLAGGINSKPAFWQ